jgi:hypothetical protein
MNSETRTADLLVALSLALASAACSSYHVTTDHDESVDVSSIRTWDFMPHREAAPGSLAGNTLVEKRVKAAVERELAAKGMRRTSDSPQVVVALHSITRDRLDATSWPTWGPGWHGRWGHWGGYPSVTVFQWTEGTLVVDLVDTRTNDLVWRGTVTEALDEKSGSAESVDEAVRKLFEAFPPDRGGELPPSVRDLDAPGPGVAHV